MVRRLLAVLAGAYGARTARRIVESAPGAREALGRTNFRGREVSLSGGLAFAAGASLAGAAAASAAATGAGGRAGGPLVGAAALVAGLGSAAVGAYDDAVTARPDQHKAKGFKGHLTALAKGQVTGGAVKIAGVGAAGLLAAVLVEKARGGRNLTDVALTGALIAGTANLFNLLDLRPGRALKAGLATGVPLAAGRGPGAALAAATCGAAGALLPADLDEEIMLGDAGANALGALVGTAFAARTGRVGRVAALAGVVALTAASEKVSFSAVIERTPALRRLDELGRRTA